MGIYKNGIVTNQNFNENSIISNMLIKSLPDNSLWARIHWLDVTSTVEWFANEAEVLHCTNKINRYSRMELVDNFLTENDNYEFMLTYPSLSSTLYNRWTQTSSANATTVTGLVKITEAWSNYNNGLRKHASSTNMYDCSTSSTWFAPIGEYQAWQASAGKIIPAANGTSQTSTELWVRIDNLKNKDIALRDKNVMFNNEYFNANSFIEI